MNSTLRELLYLAKRKPGTAEVIAGYLLKGNVPEKIQEVCLECGVTASSVTRFAKELGFSGFQELKYVLKNEDDDNGILQIVKSDIERLDYILDSETFLNLVEKIIETKEVNIFFDEEYHKYVKVLNGILKENSILTFFNDDISTLEQSLKHKSNACYMVLSEHPAACNLGDCEHKNVFYISCYENEHKNSLPIFQNQVSKHFRSTYVTLVFEFLGIKIKNRSEPKKKGKKALK